MILDPSNIQQFLSAFADGELNGSDALDVLNYVVQHPEGMEIIRAQQQLQNAALRVVRDGTPPTPDQLRQRIQAMAEESSGSSLAQLSNRPRPTPIFRKGPALTLAAAAAVIGLVVGHLIPIERPRSPVPAPVAVSIVPPTLIASVTKIHVDCSRFSLELHSGPFPSAGAFAALSTDARQEFHSQVPYPNLTSVGYAFVGAGPCKKPLENTVHLLYRSLRPTVRDTLSVFVQPFANQVTIAPGVMTLMDGDGPHPMYVWRSERAVYFLVSDDLDTAGKARDVIEVAMNK